MFGRHKRTSMFKRRQNRAHLIVHKLSSFHCNPLIRSTVSPRQRRSLSGLYIMNYQPHLRIVIMYYYRVVQEVGGLQSLLVGTVV